MKYYSIFDSTKDDSEPYPQCEEVVKISETKNAIYVLENANLFDFISCAFVSDGYVVSDRVKIILEASFKEPISFKEVTVKHRNEIYTNYHMFEVQDLSETEVDFECSIFYIGDRLRPNKDRQEDLEITSWKNYWKLKREYRNERGLGIWPDLMVLKLSSGLPPIFSMPIFAKNYVSDELALKFTSAGITGYSLLEEPRVPRLEFYK